MNHSYEDCPLHGEMISTYYAIAECLGIKIPENIKYNKDEIVRLLHNHFQTIKQVSQ